MMKRLMMKFFRKTEQQDEYARERKNLALAGLRESRLRRMTPDDRVAALEKANLDPYDYIFLAC